MSKTKITWDLKAVDMHDHDEINKTLEEGYEPYDSTSIMKKVEQQGLVQMNPNQQPMTLVTLIFFKRKMATIMEEENDSN